MYHSIPSLAIFVLLNVCDLFINVCEYVFKYIVTNNFRNIIHDAIETKKNNVKFYGRALHFISRYKRLGR